jgi:hypothetical protein
MGSGLTAGDSYPIKATAPPTGTATIEDTSALASATTSLRVSSIIAATGNALDIIFSTGLDGDDTAGYVWSSTVIGFFWSGTDSRVRQEYYFEAATAFTFDGTATNFATITTPTKDGSLTSTTNQTGITAVVNVQTTANAAGDTLQFVLPYGTTFGTTTFTFKTGSATFDAAKSLSSTTRFYQFPTVWAQTLSVTGNPLTTGPVPVQISSITTRISDYSITTAGKDGSVIFRDNGAATAACDHAKAVDWVTNFGIADTTKAFTTCSISLTATNTQSAATKAFT